MLGLKKPKIKIIKHLQDSNKKWYDDAVLITVENGKGALKSECCEAAGESNDYMGKKVLKLNNKILLQTRDPACQTCAGMLAAGYGRNIDDFSEFKKVSEAVNSNFISLEHSIADLKPLLGLLKSGIYMIADVPCYPTDGEGNFFWNVPSVMTENKASCEYYYIHELTTVIKAVPSFLYPTQFTECYNKECAEEYLNRFKGTADRPRGIAYYEIGFISALLDGHHKACAAALLGERINCITIVPITLVSFKSPYDKNNPVACKISFGGSDWFAIDDLNIADKFKRNILKNFNKKRNNPCKELPVPNITEKEIDVRYKEAAKQFPTVDEVAIFEVLEINAFTDELIEELLVCPIDSFKLEYAIKSCSRNNYPRVKEIALKALKLSEDDSVRRAAYQALLPFKDEETEKVFIDYIIENSDIHSYCRNIVDSYWK